MTKGKVNNMCFCFCSALIAFTENDDQPWKGYFYSSMFLVSSVVYSCFFHQMFHVGMTLGMRVKNSVIALVYKKVSLFEILSSRHVTSWYVDEMVEFFLEEPVHKGALTNCSLWDKQNVCRTVTMLLHLDCVQKLALGAIVIFVYSRKV